MSFFVAKKDQASLAEQGGDYINKSGIYDVTIKFASVQKSANGSMSVDFNVEYKGSNTTLYGLRLTNNDGSPNFQANLFNELLVILGIDSVEEPTMEDHVVGKDQQVKSFAVLTELSDQDIKVRVQYSYSLYQGRIIERRDIKNFYRVSDGAVASEIEKGEGFGTQLSKDIPYAENITYKDGLTPADVEAFKKGEKPSTSSNSQVTTNPFAS